MTNRAACIQNNSTADEADQLQASRFPCTVTPRSPHAASTPRHRDCAFRARTSNGSRLPKARLSAACYSHFCPTQCILKARNSKLPPVAYDKKQATQTNRDRIFFWMQVMEHKGRTKSQTASQLSINLHKEVSICLQTLEGSHTKHQATSTI